MFRFPFSTIIAKETQIVCMHKITQQARANCPFKSSRNDGNQSVTSDKVNSLMMSEMRRAEVILLLAAEHLNFQAHVLLLRGAEQKKKLPSKLEMCLIGVFFVKLESIKDP